MVKKGTDCEIHEKELFEIKTEFSQYKTTTEVKFEQINDALDEIKDKLKPQFTPAQITGFLLTILGYMVGVMLYVSDIKSDIRDNTTNIDYMKVSSEKTSLQYDNIMKSINETQREVSELKVEVKNIKR